MISTPFTQTTRRTWIALCTSALLCVPAFAQTAPQVKFKTSQGDFVVEVYPEKAPKTVENFLQYVADKHYDGTIFHRVISNFMVQGGGYTVDMNQKATRPPIALEATNGLKNDYGTIAMARTNAPHSATSQFFVNVKNNAFLNAQGSSDGYTVFGKVINGMDVVEKIKSVSTGRNDVPQTPILINSATLVK